MNKSQLSPGTVRHSARNVLDRYRPLLVVVAVALGSAAAGQVPLGWDGADFMRLFMGFFLVIFSMLKLFDVSGFADGFQMYDLIAKRSRAYALTYPFLELSLGLAYLANWRPELINVATLALMSVGAAGVLSALRKGLNVSCACLGTVLKVPLSTVAVVENVGMAAMAALMLGTR